MAYPVIWLPKAEDRFEEIVTYLEKEWGDKVVENFIQRTEMIIKIISQNPDIHRRSSKKNIREAVISKHNLLLYRIKLSHMN